MSIQEEHTRLEFIFKPDIKSDKNIEYKVKFYVENDISLIEVANAANESEQSIFTADFFVEVTDFLRKKGVLKGEKVVSNAPQSNIPIPTITPKTKNENENIDEELVEKIIAEPFSSFDIKDMQKIPIKASKKAVQANKGIEVGGKKVESETEMNSNRPVVRAKTQEESDLLRGDTGDKGIQRAD